MTNSNDVRKLQTLLIEDNPRDTVLIKEILSESVNPEINVETADRLSRALRRISEGGIDLILLDLKLPDSNWYDTFLKVRESTNGIPIIVLSGVNDKAYAIDMLSKGAQDYLIKGEVSCESLLRSVHYTMERQNMRDRSQGVRDIRMEKIFQFSRTLNACGSLKELLDAAKDMIPHLFYAEIFSIFRLESESRELILEAHNHKEWSEPPEIIAVTASDSIMWDAVRTKEMVAVKNFSQTPYARTWSRRKYKNDSAVCVPFVVRQDVLGVLNLNHLSSNWSSAANLHNIKTACEHFALSYHIALEKERN